MKNDKEKPVPMRCVCGAIAVYSKAKPGFFYACPDCLIRGGWRRTLDKATESWNAEVLQARYENWRKYE